MHTTYPDKAPDNKPSRAKQTCAPTRNGQNKRLYSLNEASVYLGRTIWAVREMLWAGKMPYIKDGRRILLDIQDMDIWIEKNKVNFNI
jgi:excisionase family DNA binding protein